MREKLSNRLGFLMMAAGCAVGLGNVWRFPYIVGKNGGAAFVLIYFVFLLLLGFPLLTSELATGRGSHKSVTEALAELAPMPAKRFWRGMGALIAAGCFVLMIYYTDVGGWLVKYTSDYACGTEPSGEFGKAFGALLANRGMCAAYMLGVVAFSTLICLMGVVKGVERVTKWMMISLLVLLGVLVVRAVTLPGAAEGLSFYLKPNWARYFEHPVSATFDAMGQAFFTLSLGVGAMTICGSYIGREHTLAKESLWIIVIDTFVAFLAGLVIFPACSAYQVNYTEGPGLIFVALPEVFARMAGGRIWGTLFFLFLAFAALTTIVAVIESLIAGLMDALGWSRRKSALVVGPMIALCAMPCVLWDGVLGWEDFAVSQVWLPLGSLVMGLFAINAKWGWGWADFRREVSSGAGWDLPNWFRWHYAIVIPILVLTIFVTGIWQKFAS